MTPAEQRLLARRKAQALLGRRNPQRYYSDALKRLREARGTYLEQSAIRELELCLILIEQITEIRKYA